MYTMWAESRARAASHIYVITIRDGHKPLEKRFRTSLTFSFLNTSNAHIWRCSKSGGKKVTDIAEVFWVESLVIEDERTFPG
jgi:hypothetical protein